MSGALRIVLTWLLVAALPLQGSAAASMSLCGTLGESAPALRHVHDAHDGAASVRNPTPVHDSVQGHGGHHQNPGHSDAAAKCSVCAACCASMAIAVADFALTLVALSDSLLRPSGRGSPLLHRRARATSPNFFLRLTPRARSGRLRPIATSWRDATRGPAMTSPACALHNRRSSDVFTCQAAGCAAPARSAFEPARAVSCELPHRGVGRGPASRRCANPCSPRLPPPRPRRINTTCRRCPGTT